MFVSSPSPGEVIRTKAALCHWYKDIYRRFASCYRECQSRGIIVEIGSGFGFAKDEIPEILTSDVALKPDIDLLIDARQLPFHASTVRAILLNNVFHHIADVGAFLDEACRCLVPGGRIFMMEPYVGFLSYWLFLLGHHERMDLRTEAWMIKSKDPLRDANVALATIVFERDQDIFRKRYPDLEIVSFRKHSPLFYWLSGGLKTWTLIPHCLINRVAHFDQWVAAMNENTASFADIVLQKAYKA